VRAGLELIAAVTALKTRVSSSNRQALAEPNMVVIAEGTRRLLGNLFELQDLGARELKGITGLVRALNRIAERHLGFDVARRYD
jgi:hypothetical protein